MGELSQICLFGGCLLMTKVPFVSRARVRTPDCPQEETLFDQCSVWGFTERRGVTDGVFDVVAVFGDGFDEFFEVIGEGIHRLVRYCVVFGGIHRSVVIAIIAASASTPKREKGGGTHETENF